MGIALSIVGIFIAAIAFLAGMGTAPSSAIQQIVVALYFVTAVLGLLVLAVSVAVHHLGVLRKIAHNLEPPQSLGES